MPVRPLVHAPRGNRIPNPWHRWHGQPYGSGVRRFLLLVLAHNNTEGEFAMQENVKTPVHLWIVGILATLWDAFGAFDYYATQTRMASYMGQFTAEQLEYFYGMPAWMDAAWAVGVWGALFGSIALLLRKAWAVWLFAASLLGLAVSTVYNFALSDGAEVMGEGAVTMTAVIWIVALALFFYARAMAARGVLR